MRRKGHRLNEKLNSCKCGIVLGVMKGNMSRRETVRAAYQLHLQCEVQLDKDTFFTRENRAWMRVLVSGI
jgi:hypothetical protein